MAIFYPKMKGYFHPQDVVARLCFDLPSLSKLYLLETKKIQTISLQSHSIMLLGMVGHNSCRMRHRNLVFKFFEKFSPRINDALCEI